MHAQLLLVNVGELFTAVRCSQYLTKTLVTVVIYNVGVLVTVRHNVLFTVLTKMLVTVNIYNVAFLVKMLYFGGS